MGWLVREGEVPSRRRGYGLREGWFAASARAAAPLDGLAACRCRPRRVARGGGAAERVRRARAQGAGLGGDRAARVDGASARRAPPLAARGARGDARGGDRRRSAVLGLPVAGTGDRPLHG